MDKKSLKSPPLAKITRPQVKDALLRERLFSLLDAPHAPQVSWVMSPPGSGKTTLVSSYIQTQKVHALWYRLDEGDSDPASFFYYLGLAGKRAAPRKRKPLPLLTPEYRLGLSVFTRNYFRDLFARLKSPFLLVLDDYHNIPIESALHEVICWALSEIPEGIRIVLISRSEPPNCLSRMQVNGNLRIISWDQIQMTLKESSDLISRMKLSDEKRKVLKEGEIRRLHHQSQGWVSGLLLMLRGKGPDGEKMNLVSGDGQDMLFRYYEEEIFKDLEDEIKRFLLRTAMLPRMTVVMAGRISSLSGARKLLSDLNHRNFFVERVAGPKQIYRYHDLFRKYLLSHGESSLSLQECSDLRHQAATLMEEEGWDEDALSLFIQVEDWDRAVGLILKLASSLMEQGRFPILVGWLGRLPQGTIRGNAWLSYWQGACILPMNPIGARKPLESAYCLFKEQGNPVGLYLSWSSIVEAYFFEWSNLKPLDLWIDEIETLLELFPVFPSVEVEIRVMMNIVTVLMDRQPHHPHLEMFAGRLLALLRNPIDINLRIMAASQLLRYYIAFGGITKTSLFIDEIDGLEESEGVTPLSQILWKASKAFKASQEDDYKHCLQATQLGLEIAEAHGIHHWDMILCLFGAHGAVMANDHPTAKELMNRAARIQDHRILQRSHFHYEAGWLAMHLGEISTAQSQAETALDLTREGGGILAQALTQMMLVQLHIIQKNWGEAVEQISNIRKICDKEKSPPIQYMLRLLEAELALVQGEEDRAVELLHRAFSLGRREAYSSHLSWYTPSMALLCSKALEEGIEVPYVQSLIRGHDLRPEKSSFDLENWPWKVKIYTLGRFSLVVDGKPVRFNRKARQKPLDLLKVLIALGGREISEAQLTDILWPEVEGDAGHHSFTITLHRLRDIIGQGTVQREGGRLTLNNQVVWVDVWTLERSLRRRTGDNEKPDKALSLYKGPFLKEEGEVSWALPLRERLEKQFLRAIANQPSSDKGPA